MHQQAATLKVRKDPPPPRDQWSDEDLMRLTQQGDSDAFALLFARYSGRLCSYLDRLGGWIDDVECVAQETFMQAFRYAHTYRYPRKFADWFYTIARNVASRRRRSWARNAIKSATDIDEQFLDRQPASCDQPGGSGVAQGVAGREESQRLHQAVALLPDYQRAVVALGVFEDRSYAEIESMTGVKAVTLRSHMFKAVRRLATILGSDE